MSRLLGAARRPRSLPVRRLPALGAAVALVALMLGALMPAAGADEGHGYIAGVVTAAIGGEPVPGVEVCAINRNGDGPWGCTTTNEAGVYTAPVSESGQYEVRFTAPRSSGLVRRTYYENTEAASEQTLVSAAVGVTTAGIDEQIPKGGEITGTVTNAITKAPVSELEVCANAVGVECVSTNASGEYVISGLPSGEFQVSYGSGAGGPGLADTYISPEYYRNHVFTTLEDEADKVAVDTGAVVSGINQEMAEYSRITGRVTDSRTAAPIPGVRVSAWTGYRSAGSTETNANGEYTLAHLADENETYYLHFNADGLDYFSQSYGARDAGELENPVKVAYGRTRAGVDQTLEAGGEVSGTVVSSATGRPIQGIDVCSHPLKEGEYKCVWTNANGEYTIELLEAGQYRIEFDNFNANYAHQYYDGVTTEKAATPVSVSPDDPRVGVDARMAPLPPLELSWAGQNGLYETWSDRENWAGGVSPAGGTAIGRLAFPALGSCPHQCYKAWNDLKGLTVEGLSIDDAENYQIGGEPFSLGAGGLAAAPDVATSEPTLARISTPIELSAAQTWRIGGFPGVGGARNGLQLSHNVTGPERALTVELASGGAIYFARDTESSAGSQVGPLRFVGTDSAQAGSANGVVGLSDAALNTEDAEPVSVEHVLLAGAGEVGPLRSVGGELAVKTEGEEVGQLTAQEVTLDQHSDLELEITGSGLNAGQDYSDLYSPGTVELGGATLRLQRRPMQAGEPCPTLYPGQTLRLVTTKGTLSGNFGNALEGAEVPIGGAGGCPAGDWALRIEYQRTGAVQAVIGTVVGAVKPVTRLATAPGDPLTNQSVALSATVEAAGQAPEGTVEFKDDGAMIEGCAAEPVSVAGSATCHAVFAAGDSPVQLQALFTPRAGTDMQGSSSAVEPLTVGRGETETGLNVSPSMITRGAEAIFTATVSPATGGPSAPTGLVAFYEGGAAITGCSAQPLQSGVAVCSTPYFETGLYGVTAVYAGDPNFEDSTSTARSVSVAPPPSAGVIPAASPGGSHVRAGVAALVSGAVEVRSGDRAFLRLSCPTGRSCNGEVTLQVIELPSAASGGRRVTVSIGAGRAAIGCGRTVSVTIRLDRRARALLKALQGHLSAQARLAWASGAVQLRPVQLVASRARAGLFQRNGRR